MVRNSSGNYHHKKDFTSVNCPLYDFDLGDAKHAECEDAYETKYDLKAFIVHRGKANSGHYFTFTLRNGTWYCCNDEMITKVKENVVRDIVESDSGKNKFCQPYVLLYALKEYTIQGNLD